MDMIDRQDVIGRWMVDRYKDRLMDGLMVNRQINRQIVRWQIDMIDKYDRYDRYKDRQIID